MDLTLIKKLTKQYEEINDLNSYAEVLKNNILKELVYYLKECKKNNPFNDFIILRLAIILYLTDDIDLSINHLSQINIKSSLYNKAILIKSFIKADSFLEEEDFQILLKAAKNTNNQEIKSMLLFSACKYWNLSTLECKNLLIKSIKLCSSHVYNLQSLASFYLDEKDALSGRQLALQALRNVTEVSFRYISGDITDPDEFIDTNIKGIYLNPILFKSLIDLIDPRAQRINVNEIRNQIEKEQAEEFI